MVEDIVENNPCEHVLVWYTNEDIHWEDWKLEEEFDSYLQNDEGGSAKLEVFLGGKELAHRVVDDGSHGTCCVTFVFKVPKGQNASGATGRRKGKLK